MIGRQGDPLVFIGQCMIDQDHLGLFDNLTAAGDDLVMNTGAQHRVGGGNLNRDAAQRTTAFGGGGAVELRFETKACAGSIWPVFYRHLALHGLGKATHNGQAQSCPVMPRGIGLVGMTEFLEDAAAGLFRNAGAGIINQEADFGLQLRAAATRYGNMHAAMIGEFHSITRQIE